MFIVTDSSCGLAWDIRIDAADENAFVAACLILQLTRLPNGIAGIFLGASMTWTLWVFIAAWIALAIWSIGR